MTSEKASLAGQVAIVTGGGSGIGKAIAIRLAADGMKVVVTGRRTEALEGTVAQIEIAGGEVLAVPSDVSVAADRERIVAQTLEKFGAIHCLVNNAAITNAPAIAGSLDETLEHWEQVIGINLTGAFVMSQLAARQMRERGSGSIVNISSVAGSAAQENAAAYCASKAGMEGMTRALALEWAALGIRVNAIQPGDILTESSADVVDAATEAGVSGKYWRQTPLGRRADASEVASVVSFLASNDASFITGETIRVDGGFLVY